MTRATKTTTNMAFHIGQRLSYDSALGTVRYLGPLEGLKGDWLGVEWDKATRGKHNGQHAGRQMFKCLSSSPTAASFLRPSRKPDPTRTLLEAINSKYAAPSKADGYDGHNHQDPIEISGKTVEEVGFDKIRKQLSHLADLKIVLVDGLNVSAVADGTTSTKFAQEELGEVCPSITELDIGWNPFETWQDVVNVVVPFGKLRIFKTSGLRLRLFSADMLADGTSPCKSISELHLNECLLKAEQVFQLLSNTDGPLFPSLKTLWLSANEFSSFDVSTDSKYETVTTLVLENNKFSTLECLASILVIFPNINYLSLQSNEISSIGTVSNGCTFPSITFLNLADNQIPSFSFIDALPAVFPNLESLRISKNPLYDQTTQSSSPDVNSSNPADSSYYLTVARIPTLKTLNYTKITARDRDDGEIYYLSVAEKDIKQILASASTSTESATQIATSRYPSYTTLCSKYDRLNILSSPIPITPASSAAQTYPNGSLGARIVKARFYIPPSLQRHTQKQNLRRKHRSSSETDNPKSKSLPTITLDLPPSLQISTLKSILSRHFNLPPLQFKLICETEEFDPVLGMERTRKEYGTGKQEDLSAWADWDVDAPNPNPDLDPNSNPDTNDAGSVENADGKPKAHPAAQPEHQPPPTPHEVGTPSNPETPRSQIQGDTSVFQKNGVQYHRREIELLDGMSSWGDFLGGAREVVVRIEPFDHTLREGKVR